MSALLYPVLISYREAKDKAAYTKKTAIMKIYNNKQSLLLDIEVDDNSYRTRAIQGDHNVVLYFSTAEHVEIPVGSYIEYQGEKYTLERPEALKMYHTRKYEYTITFESPQAKAKVWMFRNPVDGRLKFDLTARPIEHLQMFVDNMNRRDTGWTVGECIDGVETLISYDHAYCLDALTQMTSEFNTEYEIKEKQVSLRKVEYNKTSPLSLSYGKGNGFKSGISRSNYGDLPPVEILYAQGGSDNIDRSKYGASELLLPKNQTIGYDGEHFENEVGYVAAQARHYIVDGNGLSIRRTDKELSSLVEDSLDCEEYYPKRVGLVSFVSCEDEANHFWDIADKDIPANLNYEDYLLDGETMNIIFQSGMLAGKTFDVKYYHQNVTTKQGVTKEARRFEIVPTEIDGVTMPDKTTGYYPKIGDTYAVFNCYLPDAYICDNATKTGASWDMFRACVKYLYDNEDTRYSFTGEIDGIWAKKNWENVGGRIVLGGYVRFTDENWQKEPVLVRITNIKDYINNPHAPEIELSNSTVTSGVSSTLKQLQSEEVLVNDLHKQAVQYTKRRFRDAKETMEMLNEAMLDNFENGITPVSVQTMQMLVGDESLQFVFIKSLTNSTQVADTIQYDQTTKQLFTTGTSYIEHKTLGITSVSSSHNDSEYLKWALPEFKSAYLDDGDVKYYLYAKVRRNTQEGEFLLSTSAHKINEDDNYYWLLVGILNSESESERSFAPLYGFTEILPSRLTTDRVVSGDGNSYFDMLNNAMKLGDALQFNVNGDGLLKLRGTLVQSQSGTEAPIGCYRGEYNSSYTYYNGDEVTYTISGVTSTYRCVAPQPVKGVAPNDQTVWQVVAQGTKGEDGTSVKIKGTAYYHFATFTEAKAAKVESAKPCLVDDYNGFGAIVATKYGSDWTTTATDIGDGYIMADTGDLWVNTEGGWQDVGNIKGQQGEQGEKGADGDYYELRYAVNGSTTTAPAIDKTALTPSGWSTSAPTVSAAQYLWITMARKTADGQTLVTQWSTPVRTTPYDGKDGEDGKSPAMVYRGIYSSSATYYGNENRLDCVKYGDAYYICRIDAGAFSGIAPTVTDKWNAFGASFESVATQLLLAEEANIAGWVFRNNRLESQNGTVFLDGVKGEVRLLGTLQLSAQYGKVSASTSLADKNLFYLSAVSSYTIVNLPYGEEHIGKVVRIYNAGTFSQGAYGIGCYSFSWSGNVMYASKIYNAIVQPQETIELTCFATGSNSARWEITSRFTQRDFATFDSNRVLGRYPLMLAMGYCQNSNNSFTFSGTMWDGAYVSNVFSIERVGTGYYKLKFSTKNIPSGSFFVVGGYGTATIDARLGYYSWNGDNSYVEVYLSDGNSLNDGSFYFMVFAPSWDYNLR